MTDESTPSAGATTSIDFDRMTIERFRKAFPRARWSDEKKAWFVPGTTAERRVARWRALEAAAHDIHADARGRDAFLFDPIRSHYLEAGSTLVVRTPYSRTIVDELRQIPFARWDDVDRAWVVPYRSYDELRQRWDDIEAAARRNEPDARKQRREEIKGSEAFIASRRRATERRKRRYPIPADDLPPLEYPIATKTYGIVVFTGCSGEIADEEILSRFYPESEPDHVRIWVSWRPATLDELIAAWPARTGPTEMELRRGWWQPTKAELVAARKAARSIERRRSK